MDYKEVKELLASDAQLSVKQAYGILNFWKKDPKAYRTFLRYGLNFRYLETYKCYLETAGAHMFDVSDLKVPSDIIALKFFSLKDDNLSIRFMDTVYRTVEEHLYNAGVFAFPYLNKECCQHFGREFVMAQIADMRAVFDFSKDKDGRLMARFFRMMHTAEEEKLLLVNSFNTMGWLDNFCDVSLNAAPLLQEQCYERYATSMHTFGEDFASEASFRKLYISYELDIAYVTRKLLEKAFDKNVN